MRSDDVADVEAVEDDRRCFFDDRYCLLPLLWLQPRR